MHGDTMRYGETLDQALEGLFSGTGTPAPAGPAASAPGALLPEGARQRIARARRAFDRYLSLQAERKFTEAAAELAALQEALEGLAEDPP